MHWRTIARHSRPRGLMETLSRVQVTIAGGMGLPGMPGLPGIR